jgi:hypothetical protein
MAIIRLSAINHHDPQPGDKLTPTPATWQLCDIKHPFAVFIPS